MYCRQSFWLSEIELFGNETWSIEPPEGRTAENAAWKYIWIPELMEGEPVYDESSGLSKLVVVTLLLKSLMLSDVVVVVLSVPEYDMYIVDNLCSPGWEKDLTISVVSLDRQHGFKVAIPPESLPPSFWVWRKFGFKNFSLGMSLEPENTGEVIGRIVGTPVEQICIVSIPPLDNDRRAPIKWILGRNVVAVMKGIVTESSAGVD
jgi:hypothetical protein